MNETVSSNLFVPSLMNSLQMGDDKLPLDDNINDFMHSALLSWVSYIQPPVRLLVA